jgi:hypothetical protein
MYQTSKYRLMLIAATSLATASVLAACAPTYAPHIEAPHIDDSTGFELDALKPAPQLPDVDKSLTSCPAGSGFIACFTPAQEGIRQRRFTLLHDDRDYCRDAYERAVKHASGD